ncbi:hypothetical protein E2N92_12570 [Methanofollis formosanus]|uniref:Uncharacterized protein n=1 Tax=Methanofollis formosanus TaxID=299308 RepID=A0A8G1EGV8_9EURY|nr:hypothetical protein [Methanofollis formosanus]QYZ80205.1 hypothetical protein E2N92_12570 [Methanofollis formosanus]
MDVNFKRYGLYLVRWQLSTPLLAGVLILLATMDPLTATVIANLIGGLIFFWVDRFIFTSKVLAAQWEVKENIKCVDCGKVCRGYRLVKTTNYDKTDDHAPEFRCEACSEKKTEELRARGVDC